MYFIENTGIVLSKEFCVNVYYVKLWLFSECNCNPAGAKEVPGYPLGGCGVVTRGLLCECKDQVMGRICDQCKPGYYNLNRNNPHGCQGRCRGLGNRGSKS